MTALISIVLGTYNRKRFLVKTLESVYRNGIRVPYEIIIIDGGSTDGTLRYLETQKDVRVIHQYANRVRPDRPEELDSWGKFMNLGFKSASGKYICMISDDCLVVPGSIQNAYEMFEKILSEGRRTGALAFYWRDWPARRTSPGAGGPAHNEYWVGVSLGKIVVNHGMYLRKAVEDAGWIDENRYHFYHADGDLCLKLWNKGYEVVDCRRAFVEHYHHANVGLRKFNSLWQTADWKAYWEKWKGIYYDPASKKDPGGNLRITYDDLHKTWHHFVILHILNFGRYADFIRICVRSVLSKGKK